MIRPACGTTLISGQIPPAPCEGPRLAVLTYETLNQLGKSLEILASWPPVYFFGGFREDPRFVEWLSLTYFKPSKHTSNQVNRSWSIGFTQVTTIGCVS